MDHANYSICRMNDLGELIVVEEFNTYGEADKRLDHWADRYPNTCVDVFSRGVLNGCVVVS